MSYLRWQQAEARRHALRLDSPDDQPQVNKPFRTLCGETVVPRRGDIIELGGLWFKPTCTHCEAEWINLDPTATGELPDSPPTIPQVRQGCTPPHPGEPSSSSLPGMTSPLPVSWRSRAAAPEVDADASVVPSGAAAVHIQAHR